MFYLQDPHKVLRVQIGEKFPLVCGRRKRKQPFEIFL
jgi:hypothetical protein